MVFGLLITSSDILWLLRPFFFLFVCFLCNFKNQDTHAPTRHFSISRPSSNVNKIKSDWKSSNWFGLMRATLKGGSCVRWLTPIHHQLECDWSILNAVAFVGVHNHIASLGHPFSKICFFFPQLTCTGHGAQSCFVIWEAPVLSSHRCTSHLSPKSWPTNFPMAIKVAMVTPTIPCRIFGVHSMAYKAWAERLIPADA